MAKIEIVSSVERCINGLADADKYFDESCFCGNETGCKYYEAEDEKVFGSCCCYADCVAEYLGVETCDYAVKIVSDSAFEAEHANVRIGKETYWCTKVTVDGKVVYPQE